MATSRAVLHDTDRKKPDGTAKVGPTDPASRISVTVEVRRKAEMPLPAKAGRALGREELVAAYGASDQDFNAVREFAHQHGLRVLDQSHAKRTMNLAGTVADFSKAFGVELNDFRMGPRVHRIRVGTLSVPSELADVITDVRGLDNRRVAEPHYRRTGRNGSTPRATAQALSPLQVAQLYDLPPGDGTGQTIAIIELGGGFSQDDLSVYFTGLGLPIPSVTAVSAGASNSPGTDPDSDGEVMLDVEVAASMAPKAKVLVYFTTNTNQGFLAAVQQAIHDSSELPSVISISWGGPESSWTHSTMKAFETAFQDAAAMGIPVFVAAGDNGSSDGAAGLNADFPGSAPHAFSCGGTDLFASNGQITSEVVWNGGNQAGATGGGVSSVFAKPAYQAAIAVPAPLKKSGGRGVPDVAGCGGDLSPYTVRIDGQDTQVWGTSAVAPLWSGIIARFALGPIPTLHTILYQAAVEKAGFHDITQGNNDISGDNGKYSAAVGWDPCSGLGSPNGASLFALLKAALQKSTSKK